MVSQKMSETVETPINFSDLVSGVLRTGRALRTAVALLGEGARYETVFGLEEAHYEKNVADLALAGYTPERYNAEVLRRISGRPAQRLGILVHPPSDGVALAMQDMRDQWKWGTGILGIPSLDETDEE